LARQQFPDRVRVPRGERIEGVRLLHTGGHQEVERQNIVLAPIAPGQGKDLTEEGVVGLSVNQHEAAALCQGVRQHAEDGRGLARSRRSWNGRMLAQIGVGQPQFLSRQRVEADEETTVSLPRLARRRIGIIPVLPIGAFREAQG
jgi:hypothetical protein